MNPAAQEYFEKRQPFGLFWGRARRRELKEVFNQHVHVPAAGERLSVLDLGFGRLDELFTLLDFLPESVLVGVDVYGKRMKGMARELKDFGHVRVVRGELPTLAFDEEYFHLVCAFNILPLVPETAESFQTLARILKRKGHLLLSFDVLAGPDGQAAKGCEKALAPLAKNGIPALLHDEAWWKARLAETGLHLEKEFQTKGGMWYCWAVKR